MKTIKGPALFLAQFPGDDTPLQFVASHYGMGSRLRLQGRAGAKLGCAAFRSRHRGAVP
jgi:hypothetical protein